MSWISDIPLMTLDGINCKSVILHLSQLYCVLWWYERDYKGISEFFKTWFLINRRWYWLTSDLALNINKICWTIWYPHGTYNFLTLCPKMWRNCHLQGRPSRECQRALAPLVFWSGSLKKSKKVSKISKSKSRCSKWHQLFLPSLGANELALLIYA